MKVLALIFDGFEEEEATAPFALLRRAKISLDIASNKTLVTGSHNITIKSDISDFTKIDYKNYDCLLIPGGAHYKFIRTNNDVLTILKYFMDNNKYVALICAAPTILGEMGYLKGKNYTCFTSMNSDFGGTYIDKKVVVDGKLITSRSVAAALDFAYRIIENLAGKETLDLVKKQIYYEK